VLVFFDDSDPSSFLGLYSAPTPTNGARDQTCLQTRVDRCISPYSFHFRETVSPRLVCFVRTCQGVDNALYYAFSNLLMMVPRYFLPFTLSFPKCYTPCLPLPPSEAFPPLSPRLHCCCYRSFMKCIASLPIFFSFPR